MKFFIWGKKVGMTQSFSSENDQVVPLTVVAMAQWYVLQKINEGDGFFRFQLGMLRSKYEKNGFSSEYLKNKSRYFLQVKEVVVPKEYGESLTIGALFDAFAFLKESMVLSVTGTSIGKGFQGAVKRHGFSGGRGSHGDKLGRKPGSLSGLRTQGRVFKGKKLPGRCGGMQCTIKGASLFSLVASEGAICIKGGVPGKKGSLVRLSWEVR